MSGKAKETPAVQKPIDEMTTEEMQAAVLRSQLKTQLMLEKQAEHTADKFENDTRSKEQKAAAAQKELDITSRRKEQQKEVCRHRQGGFGLEGTFKGKGEHSLIEVTTCIPGHRLIYCYRCEGEWRTPQPSLKKADPAEYKRQMREWKEIEEMFGECTSTGLAGPVFAFEKDGAPYVPDRV